MALLGVAAVGFVAVDFLNPLQIDHRHDADLEIGATRSVDRFGDDGAVQPLVEQQFGILRQILPGRESAGRPTVGFRFRHVVDVMPRASGPLLAVFAEQGLELVEQVGAGAEVAEIDVALAHLFGHRLLHAGAVVAVERVAFDEGGDYALAAKNLIERPSHRGGAGARRTGDRNDGMFDRHDPPQLNDGFSHEQPAPGEQR